MVPQTETDTETDTGAGFKAGVKDYRLTYYTPDYVVKDSDISASLPITPQPGVPPFQKTVFYTISTALLVLGFAAYRLTSSSTAVNTHPWLRQGSFAMITSGSPSRSPGNNPNTAIVVRGTQADNQHNSPTPAVGFGDLNHTAMQASILGVSNQHVAALPIATSSPQDRTFSLTLQNQNQQSEAGPSTSNINPDTLNSAIQNFLSFPPEIKEALAKVVRTHGPVFYTMPQTTQMRLLEITLNNMQIHFTPPTPLPGVKISKTGYMNQLWGEKADLKLVENVLQAVDSKVPTSNLLNREMFNSIAECLTLKSKERFETAPTSKAICEFANSILSQSGPLPQAQQLIPTLVIHSIKAKLINAETKRAEDFNPIPLICLWTAPVNAAPALQGEAAFSRDQIKAAVIKADNRLRSFKELGDQSPAYTLSDCYFCFFSNLSSLKKTDIDKIKVVVKNAFYLSPGQNHTDTLSYGVENRRTLQNEMRQDLNRAFNTYYLNCAHFYVENNSLSPNNKLLIMREKTMSSSYLKYIQRARELALLYACQDLFDLPTLNNAL